MQETPKTILAIAVALGCLPDIEGKSLRLKTSCAPNTGFRGLLLCLSWKLPPWGLTCIVPEGTMPSGQGEKQSIFLLCDTYGPQQWPVQQEIPKDAMVAHSCWWWPTAV